MQRLAIFTICALALVSFTGMQQKERIIFFGDSITQAGVQPQGYITVLGNMMKQKGLQDRYELIGAGIGGNKVYDLYLRMDDDVMAKTPTTVVVWVGVNDVWHKRTAGTGTDAPKFLQFYRAIIKKLQAKNIKVVLVTPAAIGEKNDMTNELDGDLNKYAGFIRGLAQEFNCPLVDLRKIFLAYDLANNPENKEKGILTVDGVHLTDQGNKLVADEMMKTLVKP